MGVMVIINFLFYLLTLGRELYYNQFKVDWGTSSAGERCLRMAEARGSNPLSSTK